METLKKNAANLVKVKTFFSLGLLIVYTVLALRGDILPDSVVDTFKMVMIFYFGTQAEKGNK